MSITRCLLLFLLLQTALCFADRDIIPLTLEYARSQAEIEWGLMQRDHLPQDHGMLFIYPSPRHLSFWMFNCLMDLSVAFLDGQGVVQEIHELKAYPERMDPKRPVTKREDLLLYPPYDPVVAFFRDHRVKSCYKATYALEMEAGWFEKRGMRPGDRLVFHPPSPEAYFVRGQKGKSGL